MHFRCFIFVHSSFICSRRAAVVSSSKLKICFNTNVWTATTSCRDPAEKYWNRIASDISHSFVLSHVANTGVNEMAGAMHREVVRIAANNRYLTTFTCCCFFCLIFFSFAFLMCLVLCCYPIALNLICDWIMIVVCVECGEEWREDKKVNCNRQQTETKRHRNVAGKWLLLLLLFAVCDISVFFSHWAADIMSTRSCATNTHAERRARKETEMEIESILFSRLLFITSIDQFI